MSILIDPEEIIIEFLRNHVTDPRNRFSSDSDSFTATSGQTVFVLTPSDSSHLVRSIISVSLNGSVLEKWQDYDIDLRDKEVILKNGASEDDSVVVSYNASASGDEWIFPNRPISSLGQTNFPRISVEVNDIGSARSGNYDSALNDDVSFRIMVHVKDNYSTTVSGKKYSKQDLCNYLGMRVKKAFREYINELYPKFYDYIGLTSSPLPFDEESQVYLYVQDVQLSGVNVGE